ncbi:DUF3180 domain-containing protein [uncultured Microbacterium sp.]|uniref:DUF3180 domain-containing protein n=1 Tax=uncultured Microbacterium sp. TaxID=191216 RepID=A0A1Y5NXH0_9MICO|nr:DUF3180 domain-containing protein [uncultured Microbacterium sp.]SBS71132.1 conserved membrane hypothetical protein [uncultured Microbacterium sp.]
MKRTGATLLLTAALVGAVVGFVADQLLTAGGRPTFTPSLMLPVLLVLLGAVTVLLALPIRRAITGSGTAPVDPFRAVRIAMLAKASSIVGAFVAGVALGLLAFLLTRPVTPSLGSTSAVVAAVVGGVVLVAAGLVAEHLCTIRKDDDDEQPGPDEPGFGLSHHD